MKKLQYRLTLPSRENNIEDRYNDGVEGHPASRTLSVIPDKNGYICILWKEGNLDKKMIIFDTSRRKRSSESSGFVINMRSVWNDGNDTPPVTPHARRQTASTSLLIDEINERTFISPGWSVVFKLRREKEDNYSGDYPLLCVIVVVHQTREIPWGENGARGLL